MSTPASPLPSGETEAQRAKPLLDRTGTVREGLLSTPGTLALLHGRPLWSPLHSWEKLFLPQRIADNQRSEAQDDPWKSWVYCSKEEKVRLQVGLFIPSALIPSLALLYLLSTPVLGAQGRKQVCQEQRKGRSRS